MLSVGTSYAFRPNNPVYHDRAKFRQEETRLKRYEIKLIDRMGVVYYAMVEAYHFPGAYSKGKRIAKEMDCVLGVIHPVK